jgi:hypothetical protein
LRAQSTLQATDFDERVRKTDQSSQAKFVQAEQAIKTLQANLGEVVDFVKMLNGEQEKLTERLLAS